MKRFIDYLEQCLTESGFRGTVAAVMYGTCSVSMAFINKALMTSFEFDYPVFIMVMQMLFTITLLEVLSCVNLIDMPRYTLQRGKSFALPAFFYGVNSVLGLSALSHMNVAMYGVLKRCVPLVTMFLSVAVLRKPVPSKTTILSVILLTMGCVIAGYGDLKFNWLAYTCGALSNLSQSLYLLLVQRYCERDISTVETLQLNSVNTLPFLTIYMCLNGEIFKVTNYSTEKPLTFFIVFVLAVSMGCLLNYTLFLCTSLTSALTTSVVGGLKAMVQTLFGLFTFGGISHNFPTYIGISMNLSGGVWYIYDKYSEGQRSAPGSHVMKKITSLSTAEDFHRLATLQKSYGNGMRSSGLQSISEESHQRHPSHSDDTVISFEQSDPRN
ncbi:uncharacterized protein LOC134260038 [Saccostrea cucullata]|uniref:uncharacterized protein LOC134260038 n=1 Tax=Saccostrea cuccullata TaxID=36930 RepID=UPI002ED5E6A8